MLAHSNNRSISDGLVLKNEYTEFQQDNKENKLKLYNPTIALNGHKGEIYTGKFSNEGYIYATAGHDKNILLWEVFEESCRNLTALQGHSNAILELTWSQDDSRIYSCSADKSVCIWDVYESKRIKKLKGHESFVNCLDNSKRGPEIVLINI
jgi:Prp8 binding protein